MHNLRSTSEDVPGQRQPVLAPLRPLTDKCNSANCPTIYKSPAGTLVVQGYAVPAEQVGVDLPDGEMLVEIPAGLLTEAVSKLAALA